MPGVEGEERGCYDWHPEGSALARCLAHHYRYGCRGTQQGGPARGWPLGPGAPHAAAPAAPGPRPGAKALAWSLTLAHSLVVALRRGELHASHSTLHAHS